MEQMNLWDFIYFTLRSSLEYIAIIALMFTLFKIEYKHMKYQIGFVCLILSYVSYTTRLEGLTSISPMVQLVLLILFVWLLFQIQVFYAALISIVGYHVYGGIQSILAIIMEFLGALSLDNPNLMALPFTILAVLSSVSVLLISYIIKKNNWGFTFVPHSPHRKVKLGKDKNRVVLIVILFGIVLFGISYYFTYVRNLPELVYLLTIVNIVISILVIYYAIRKETNEDSVDG